MSTQLATLGADQVRRQVLSRTADVGGCLNFLGCLNKGGYGCVRIGGRAMLAHRAVWTAANGHIPDGHEVCHSCDNRACVNIEHLFLGTRLDNMRDMISKGRDNKASGSRHGMAKLNEAIVTAIRIRHQRGERGADLAREFGLSKSGMHSITSRKLWRNV